MVICTTDLKAVAGIAQYGKPRKTFQSQIVKRKKFSERTAIVLLCQKIRNVSEIVTALNFCGKNEVLITEAVVKFTADRIT